MRKTDARPPPSVCELIAQVLGRTLDSANLVELREKHPVDFVLLLHHASWCPTCRQVIDQAFPSGFVSSQEAKQLEKGLAAAEQLSHREHAERASAQRTPEEGDAGTKPRGDG